MVLTWKDFLTTLLAGGTVGMYFIYAHSSGGYRIPILLLAVLGIAMCALSGGAKGNTAFTVVASVLGVLALLLIAYGLITGAKVVFLLLAGTVLVLWIVATLRHAIGA